MFSLRAKLLLVGALLVAIPGVVFAFMTIVSARRALENAVGLQLAEVAHDAAAQVSELLTREQHNVAIWSTQDAMREVLTGDPDKRLGRFLASLKESDLAYRDVLCADAAGRVVAATDARLLGDQVTQRAMRSALNGFESLAGPYVAGDDGHAVVEIAAPIYDPAVRDRVIGALSVVYDWERGGAVAKRAQRNAAALTLMVDVLILDDEGRVVSEAPPVNGSPLAGKNLRQDGWRAARPAHTAAGPSFQREPAASVLVGFAPLRAPQSDWTVLVTQPLAAALAPVDRLQRRLILLLGGVLLVALGIGLLLAERISRPLLELTAATREIARAGDTRVPVRSRDELGQLAAAFNTMAGELKRAQDDLVRAAKFAFVGEVAAGVAHEIRTPLSILRSSAQILGRSLPTGPPGNAELVGMMISEVDRLDRVVDGLLELGRAREPQFAAVALAPLLARTLDFVERQAEGQGVRLRRELDPSLTPARCDPEQIYQVALNLVVNALQVLPPGGLLTVRTIRGTAGRVGFEVIDNGPGIAAELTRKVFTPFFTMREGGTGLGLALVERVIQAHHGEVQVYSVVGQGTTFRVELPGAEES